MIWWWFFNLVWNLRCLGFMNTYGYIAMPYYYLAVELVDTGGLVVLVVADVGCTVVVLDVILVGVDVVVEF